MSHPPKSDTVCVCVSLTTSLKCTAGYIFACLHWRDRDFVNREIEGSHFKWPRNSLDFTKQKGEKELLCPCHWIFIVSVTKEINSPHTQWLVEEHLGARHTQMLHMALMKPHEVLFEAKFFWFCFFFFPPVESEGNCDMRRDQTALKSYINRTGIQNDKQSSLLSRKFTACTSLSKRLGKYTGGWILLMWFYAEVRRELGLKVKDSMKESG